MRLLNLFAVIDTRAQAIIGPIVHDHNETPITRQIIDALKTPNTMIAKNPEDFVIVHLGTVDEETGEITGKKPEVIATALALKASIQ